MTPCLRQAFADRNLPILTARIRAWDLADPDARRSAPRDVDGRGARRRALVQAQANATLRDVAAEVAQ